MHHRPVHGRTTTRALALAAVALCLTACSDSGDDDAPAPDETTGSVELTSYASVDDLREAVIDAGLECDRWVQDDEVASADASGSCGRDYTLAWYADTESRDAGIDQWRSVVAELEAYGASAAPLVAGADWTLQGGGVPRVADELGGVVETVDGEPAA